jgi:hypothetical protein
MVLVDSASESFHKVDVVGCAWGTVDEESSRFCQARQGETAVMDKRMTEGHAIAPGKRGDSLLLLCRETDCVVASVEPPTPLYIPVSPAFSLDMNLNSVASAFPVACCGVSERILNDIVP